MNIKQMTVTPELAKQFLTKNTNNRNIRTSVVKRYAADMLAGKFPLMPHGIVFLKDGTLADGQHRLLAIVESNTTQEMIVAFDCDPEIIPNQDGGQSRLARDRLVMSGEDWASKSAIAVLNLVFMPDRYQKTFTVAQMTNLATAEVVDAIQFVGSIFTGNRKNLSTAPVQAAIVLCLLSQKGVCKERVAQFAQVVLFGHGNGEQDSAAVTLRNKLIATQDSQRGATERLLTMKVVQACLDAFLLKKTVKRVPKHDELVWPKIKGGAA